MSEAIRDAIRRMQEADAAKRDCASLANSEEGLIPGERAEIRRGVRRGVEDIAAGRYDEYDADGLERLAKELVDASAKKLACRAESR